jgi:hypothetical protein
MRKAIGRGLCVAALTLVAFASGAVAQDTVRVRGTIDRLEGPVYVVKSRDGTEMKVALADNGLVVALVKASLADIKQGSFVGATGMPSRTAARRRSRSTSSRRRCVAPAKDIIRGICAPTLR